MIGCKKYTFCEEFRGSPGPALSRCADDDDDDDDDSSMYNLIIIRLQIISLFSLNNLSRI